MLEESTLDSMVWEASLKRWHQTWPLKDKEDMVMQKTGEGTKNAEVLWKKSSEWSRNWKNINGDKSEKTTIWDGAGEGRGVGFIDSEWRRNYDGSNWRLDEFKIYFEDRSNRTELYFTELREWDPEGLNELDKVMWITAVLVQNPKYPKSQT